MVEATPNELGVFQRVYVQPRETVPISVRLPEGDPGEQVGVAAQDGGKIVEVEAVAGVFELDAQRTLHFNFQLNEDEGIYRITLRRGGEVKVIELWAGAPLALASR